MARKRWRDMKNMKKKIMKKPIVKSLRSIKSFENGKSKITIGDVSFYYFLLSF